jgi:sulfatase modifying factor 1
MLVIACGGTTEIPSEGGGSGGTAGSSTGGTGGTETGGGGSGGTAGTGGSGGSAGSPIKPASCASPAPGADESCGGSYDCCSSVAVPGGTFNRLNKSEWPATVSAFQLDKFEVTVGRFRAFIAEYPSSLPGAGAGAAPGDETTGWQAAWKGKMPATREALVEALHCSSNSGSDEYPTWTDEPGSNERLPISCLTWYEAFAFCVWDGGRLPTAAEWNYVAVGGDEQRAYPWGDSPTPDAEHAVTLATPNGQYVEVGSVPAGATRWGQLDFSGSRKEFALDMTTDSAAGDELPLPCVDCVDMTQYPHELRVLEDMSFYQAPENRITGYQLEYPPDRRSDAISVRCARAN